VVELRGAAATVWHLLEEPTSAIELAAAFARADAVDELESSDPLARLAAHDLLTEVP